MQKEYYEMILEGPEDLIKGYLFGFMEGRRLEGEIIFERGLHVKKEQALAQLVRLLYHEDKFRVMVEETVGGQIMDSLAETKHHLDIRIVSFRRIAGAEFRFEFRVFSRELGEKYRKIFVKPPEGVEVLEYKLDEEVHPDAKGIEAYAPEHEYEIRAKGLVRGKAREVIDLYDRIEHLPFMELTEIDIALES
jgi:hypothetical protein